MAATVLTPSSVEQADLAVEEMVELEVTELDQLLKMEETEQLTLAVEAAAVDLKYLLHQALVAQVDQV